MRRTPRWLTGLCCLVSSLLLAPVCSASDTDTPSISLSPVVKSDISSQEKYVFDVVIHTPEDMNKLLGRIESLAMSTPLSGNTPGLALVLHGPEIAFFSRKNYSKYMSLVDRAASLDKKGIIDVKVCDTMIRELQINSEELPEYIDHVPYGPAEVDRLVKQGFIRM